MATFLGKFAFGSSNISGQQYFLTSYQLREAAAGMTLPGMAAESVSDTERCILYAAGNNMIVQLADLSYLTLNTTLGWIELNTDPAQAVQFQVTSQNNQQTWQVQSGGNPRTIGYTIDNPSPLLTINGGSGIYTTFVPQQITAPLSTILQTRSGAHMDFCNVDLSGTNLTSVDFTGADFTAANLQGTIFDNCMLTGAHFEGAQLANASFNGATLDNATFTGATTTISQVKWGQPKSARGIQFTNCIARGTQLGSAAAQLDCTGANLSGADFSGANLQRVNVTQGNLSGAILAAGCNASGAVFDGADLTSLVAVAGIFNGASLQDVIGHGAVFVAADLTNAKLTRSLFGSKALLFTLPESMVSTLNTNKFVTQAIIDAFGNKGITLLSTAAITVVAAGQSWIISDPKAGVFNILNNADSSALNVFLESASLRPAIFTGATMFNTQASEASFASADLTGVAWYSTATAAHADLSSAMFTRAYLLGTDFTQAQVAGTDFSSSVLIQSKLRGIVIGPGSDNRATNFSRAQLQGTDLTGTTLNSVLLSGATVALPQGVPLFVMPLSYQAALNTQGLPQVAQYFAQQGYPLGTGATIEQIHGWQIDNSSDTKPLAVKTFLVNMIGSQLKVYDNSNHHYLFTLAANMLPFLKNYTTPQQPLIMAFQNQNQDLAPTATIAPVSFWQITNSADAPGEVAYQYIGIYAQTDGLHVYGATVVWLRAYSELSGSAAFGATINVQAALNAQSLAPNGYPRALFDQQLFTWEQLMTPVAGT